MLLLEESGVMVWGWLYTGIGETGWLYSVTGGRVFWGWLYSDIGWLYKDTGGIAFWDWLYSSGFDMDSKEVEWVGDCNVVVSGIGERAGVCWMGGPTDVDRTWNKHSIMKRSVTQSESVANSSHYLYSLAISTRSRTGEIWPVCHKCRSRKKYSCIYADTGPYLIHITVKFVWRRPHILNLSQGFPLNFQHV